MEPVKPIYTTRVEKPYPKPYAPVASCAASCMGPMVQAYPPLAYKNPHHMHPHHMHPHHMNPHHMHPHHMYPVAKAPCSSVGEILVLFILLVIISRAILRF